MQKRMTLLARRTGMRVEDFRAHWAGPHARIAMTIQSIARYVQNQVLATLWERAAGNPQVPAYQVDGIVEMTYGDAASMAAAQASHPAKVLIPQDEPNFIRGWTLSVVDTEGDDGRLDGAKVIVLLDRPEALAAETFEDCVRALFARHCGDLRRITFNWTRDKIQRPTLWHEPQWPDAHVVLVFDDPMAMTACFMTGAPLRAALDALVVRGAAFHVDALTIQE